MSKTNLRSEKLPVCVLFLRPFPFFQEIGRLSKRRPNKRCRTPHCLLPAKKEWRASHFSCPFWGMQAPKECFKEIPPGEDNKHGSVSCVCSRLAVGSRWTSQRTECLHRAHSACLDFIHGLRFISHVSTPSKLSTISPLTPPPVKANPSK